jgi:hypothetical protein
MTGICMLKTEASPQRLDEGSSAATLVGIHFSGLRVAE